MTSLRTRMTEDMQIRNLAVHTQNTYLLQVALFARHFNKSPELLGPEQIRTYQVYLTNEKKLATSSILIAIAALRFLYKVTLKKSWASTTSSRLRRSRRRLPVILSPEEVIQFLEWCRQVVKHRAISDHCNAAGLRISEPFPSRRPPLTASAWSCASNGQRKKRSLRDALAQVAHHSA